MTTKVFKINRYSYKISILGFLSNTETITNTFSFEFKDSDFNSENSDSNLIFESLFYSSLKTQIYQRKYLKFQDTLSSLGGFIHVLILVGWMMMSLPLEFYFTKTLVNKIYSFQPHIKSPNKTPHTIEKNIEKLSIIAEEQVSPKNLIGPTSEIMNSGDVSRLVSPKNINPIVSYHETIHIGNKKGETPHQKMVEMKEISLSPRNKEKNLSKLDKISNRKLSEKLSGMFIKHKTTNDKFEQFRQNISKKFKLSIGFISFLSLKIKKLFKMKNNKKQHLFKISENSLKNEMDISKILLKLHDIEKLKSVLFDENQLLLFNLIGNPMIYLKKDVEEGTEQSPEFKMGQRLRLIEDFNEESLRNLKKYYSEQEKKTDLNEIDHRLIKITKESVEKFTNYFI